MESGAVYLTLVLLLQVSTISSTPYYGALIGDISTIHHLASGTVYAATATTLVIRGFSYDGTAPDAFLWIGSSSQPDSSGVIVPLDPDNPDEKLGRFTDAVLVVGLPSGSTISDYRWLSVWCRQFTANFGHVNIPANFVAPAVHDLGRLPTYAHQVRADSVKVLDAKTLRFENLFYDGNGPDAYFWAGVTPTPTRNGFKLIWKPSLPATGTNQRLDRSYRGETVDVTMPDGMTVFDITYAGLWCVRFTQNFGHVSINPNELNVPAILPEMPFDHCEVLSDNEFQVSWKVDGTSITVQLAGRVTPGNYLAFGLSGSDTRTLMDGSDVVVAWMDEQSMSPMVVDYNLESKAQCSVNNGNGACPDDVASVGGTNNAALVELLSDNGIARISYTRPLNTGDATDKIIPTDSRVYISWAIGPINPDGRVAKHVKAPTDNPTINFGRQGTSNCPAFTAVSGGGNPLQPWTPSSIEDETTFAVDIGQSGGERGYTGITGKVGWGIAWYVNGFLIPEITVQRGTAYTFQVFGGDDPALSAQYHPFYITDDAEGGYAQKTEAEKIGVTIYAGPTVGPYCEWQVQNLGISPDDYDSFIAYRYYLERNCNNPNPTPGLLIWTPDGSTPDLVYYQCYTHRFLGWKIRVVDGPGVTGTMPGAPATSPRPATATGGSGTSESSGLTSSVPPTTLSTDLGANPSPTGSAIASATVSVAVTTTALLTVLLL